MSQVTDDIHLLLRALKCGACEFVQPTQELRFNGLLHSTYRDIAFRDWSRLVNVMGRVNLEAAIKKHGGRPL